MKAPKVGICVTIIKDDKVLLGKRNEDSDKTDSELHGEGSWMCPGGKLEFGENIEDCARREVFEETGMKVNKLEFISVTNDIVSDAHFITLGFLCKDFEGEPKITEPDEITEWKWFHLNNLPGTVFFPSDKSIKNYLEGKVYKGD